MVVDCGLWKWKVEGGDTAGSHGGKSKNMAGNRIDHSLQ